MISKFYLVVSVIILFSFKISAQQSNLSFGADGVVHEDTLSIGDTINFNFWIVNQGASNYNDSISISNSILFNSIFFEIFISFKK